MLVSDHNHVSGNSERTLAGFFKPESDTGPEPEPEGGGGPPPISSAPSGIGPFGLSGKRQIAEVTQVC